MSEFDGYLERLHSALDLSRNRADEICAEVRTHLEARARELQESGLAPQEAAAEAVGSFGDPVRLASDLRYANRRHRAFGLVRAFVALAIVLGCMAALVDVAWDKFPVLTRLAKEIARSTPLIEAEAGNLILAVLTVPATLLAGMVAGRRHWWVAGAPPILWVIGFGVQWAGGQASGCMIDRATLTWPIGGAVVFGGSAYLGARMTGSRLARAAAWALLGGYVLAVAAMALSTEVRDAVARWAVLATAGAFLNVVVFGVYREMRPGRRAVWVAAGLCAAVAAAPIITGFAGFFKPWQPAWTATWRTIALAEVTLVAAGAISLWGRRVRVGGRVPLPGLIAVVLVIGAAAPPAFRGMLSRSREEACMNNMRALLQAFSLYAADNDGSLLPRLPKDEQYTEAEEAYLVSSYAHYVGGADLWHCPAQPRARTAEEGRAWKRAGRARTAGLENPYHRTYYYGWEPRLTAPRMLGGRRVLLDVIIQDCFLIGTPASEPELGPHGPARASRMHFGYGDGHVESLTGKERWQRWEAELAAGLVEQRAPTTPSS